MAECVFCRILSGAIPGQKVFESDTVAAFLDINPVAFGHTLVMPKEHHETLTDAPPGLAADLARAAQLVARAVLKATGAEGFNLLSNNRRCAGQAIDHVHLHVIPRKTGDSIRFGWNTRKYGEGEIERTAEAVRKAASGP